MTTPDTDPFLGMIDIGFPAYDGLRGRVQRVLESTRFVKFITAIILLNAVTLGMETDPGIMAAIGPALLTLDSVVLTIFVAEILAKLFVYRLGFFKSGWNVFDLIIVTVALVPSAGPLSVLRALRILRVLRLLSVVPQMRSVVSALLHAIPGMASIIAVLFLVFYVSAVLATKLFGLSAAATPDIQEWFGSVWASMYSLFQIMTLESWSMGIVRPVMEVFPLAWVFFVPFIVLTSFAVLNLFIAIIVNAMQGQHEAERAEQEAEIRKAAHDEAEQLSGEIRALRSEIAELKALISARPAGQ